MSNKPKVSIIGSCVSRDVFNSRFIGDYKDYLDLGETVYQTALPSIVEQEAILNINASNVRSIFEQTLNEEYSGGNIQRVLDSRPDFVILDFFADIHFGITRKMGRYLTRNHMAFQTLESADTFFDDMGVKPPERMRFSDAGYRELAIRSLREFSRRLKGELPKVEFIVNSARFSTKYTDSAGALNQFPTPERLLWKNNNWDVLDEIAIGELSAKHIAHDDALFIASTTHPWGLHPVHYTQAYYDSLWQDIRKTIGA